MNLDYVIIGLIISNLIAVFACMYYMSQSRKKTRICKRQAIRVNACSVDNHVSAAWVENAFEKAGDTKDLDLHHSDVIEDSESCKCEGEKC